MNKKIILIILIGILVRLFIMPFYFHPDIKTYHFQSSFLSRGVFDIYSYIPAHRSEINLKEEFVYFPLAYYFLGTYQFIATPFLGSDFADWLSDASSTSTQAAGFSRYLFILKLPYLVFDIAIGFLLMRFFVAQKDKEKVLTFWMLNPFSIVLIYVFSNIDIIPVFFSVLSLFYIRANNPGLAGLMLGLGAGFKAYPLIFLPTLLILSNKKYKTFLAAVGVFVTILLPFLGVRDFWSATLVSGLTTRILQPVFGLGFGEVIFIPVLILGVFFVYLTFHKVAKNYALELFLVTMLLLFGFIHFHVQWLLWLVPFAVLLAIQRPEFKIVLILFGIFGFMIPVLYQDKYMSVSILSGFSVWFNLLPTPFLIIQKVYDPFIIQGILHTAVAAIALVVSYELLQKGKDE